MGKRKEKYYKVVNKSRFKKKNINNKAKKRALLANATSDGSGAVDLDPSPTPEPENPPSFTFIECVTPEGDTLDPAPGGRAHNQPGVATTSDTTRGSAILRTLLVGGSAPSVSGAGSASSSRCVAVVAPSATATASEGGRGEGGNSAPPTPLEKKKQLLLSHAPNMNSKWPAMYIDTQKVIKEVSLRALLWDPSHALYTNRDARQASWRSVCREIVPDFDEVSDPIQKKTEVIIQRRWRSSRETYVKMKASNSSIKSLKGKTYEHAKLLTFLDPTLQYMPVARSSNEQLDPLPLPIPNPGSRVAGAAGSFTARKKMKPTIIKTQPTKHKHSETMSPFENQLLECLRGEFNTLAADDRDFFKSLGPVLNTFSSTQKLLFRSKVMAIVTEMTSEGEGEEEEAGYGEGEDEGDVLGHMTDESLEEEPTVDLEDSPSSPETKFPVTDTIDE